MRFRGTVNKRHTPAARRCEERRDDWGFFLARELPEVSLLELAPFRRIVIEPFAQTHARRHVFCPNVELQLAARNAARPHAVYEYSITVGRVGLVVSPSNVKRHR